MTDSVLILKNLLFLTSDIYSDWYFFILKKLESPEGLNLEGTLGDITSSKLNDNGFKFKVHFLLREQFSKMSSDFMWYRRTFPSILFFPSDVISVSYDGEKQINIKLVQKGIDRILVEHELLDVEKSKSELISYLDHTLRNTHFFELKKVFENISIKDFPDVGNDDLWKWYNSQDKKTFWGSIGDLQEMFESLTIIKKSAESLYTFILPMEIKQIKSIINKL